MSGQSNSLRELLPSPALGGKEILTCGSGRPRRMLAVVVCSAR